jgi:aspartate/methionine/tyrosine aminotransferase
MIKTADRISKLGTETAFAVSAEAAVFAADGNKVYPFHLGDLNIKTPDTVVDAALKAIKEGKTGYCPTLGISALRHALADDINHARGTDYNFENIAIQPGGKPTIGKFILALMNPGDEVLYPNPGYPIYESQIEFNGGKAVPYSYTEGKDGFYLDVESIEGKITGRTKAIVINNPQNPTSADCSFEELTAIANLAIKYDLVVLSDEAYFDIRYEGKSYSIASIPGMKERTIILYTFSKKYAMSGWRLGATIAPKKVIDVIGMLNVNDESCSNHFVQYGALGGLTGTQDALTHMLIKFKERRDIVVDILNTIPGIKCFRPTATFYVFANVTELMKQNNYSDYESFRKDVLHNTGVSFCTRLHFGRISEKEENKYIRIAYSGIEADEIREGLNKFKDYFNNGDLISQRREKHLHH